MTSTSLKLILPLAAALILCGAPNPAKAHDMDAVDESRTVETGRNAAIIHRDEADRLWVFAESAQELGSGGEFHIYVDPETHPHARASFAEFSLGPGGALPVHRHDRSEEIGYFLSGEGVVQFEVDGELREMSVGRGHVWYNPPGTWHAVRNTGDGPLSLVFATIPNDPEGLMSFFRRIGTKPGEEPTTLPPREFARLAAEHDLVLRPPPEPD